MLAQQILLELPWLAKRIRCDQKQLSCSATNSQCDILTSDNWGTSGGNPDVVILDEAVQVQREEFASHLLNNASKKSDSLTIISTNAGFQDTWQFKLRELARTSPQWSFSQGNERPPQMSVEEFEEARARNTPTSFARFYLGVWASGTGDLLPSEVIEAAINDGLRPMDGAEPGWYFVGGLDLATHRDHAALAVVAVNPAERRLRLANVESWAPAANREIDLEEIYTAVLQTNCQYPGILIARILGKRSCLFNVRRREGVAITPVPFVGKTLNAMATTMLQVFNDGLLEMYRDARLVTELSRLRLVEKSFGVKIEAPRTADGHCDRAMALSIALLLASECVGSYQEPIDDGLGEYLIPNGFEY